MNPWIHLDTAQIPRGGELRLMQRGQDFSIMSGTIELMNSRLSGSEVALANLAWAKISDRPAPRMLIGGLGMGFTLRAALDLLGSDAQVTVCELIPAIADWNRGILGPLAGHPLRDPRVGLRIMYVMDLLEDSPEDFDVILMDTDNGPDFTVRAENERLYGRPGLEAVRAALRPGGIAAFWSAEVSDPFEARLTGQGWDWQREDVQLAGGRADAFHHVYFGRDRMAQVLLPTHGGWALAHTIR